MTASATFSAVMAGLVPAIHVFRKSAKQDADARVKRGHDDAAAGERTP
jgi:hypothetical protein